MFDSFRDNGGKGTFAMKAAYSTNDHWIFEKPGLFMGDLLEFFTAIGMADTN